MIAGHGAAPGRRARPRRILWAAALAALAVGATAAQPAAAGTGGQGHGREREKPRTVVTTDIESDDLASLIRYVLYTNELDTEGIVYTSGRYHWSGDGKGTEFFLPGREYTTPQTSWRWSGSTVIEDQVVAAYAKVYPNLRTHDRDYPTPRELLSTVKLGNIEFENEMTKDTAGSDLIKRLLLDRDDRTLYLQAWGGTNTIARALKSIEEQYSGSRQWPRIKEKVSEKAVILASGFQDDTYAQYIAPNWPALQVRNLQAGYATWGFNCNRGTGNVRGLPQDRVYFTGAWIKQNIQTGPLGSLYRSWLDGQSFAGDPLDIFGDPEKAPGGWCKPLGQYDFLSEGDNVTFTMLLNTGIQDPSDPAIGGWGGRSAQSTSSPDLWTLVPSELDATGTPVANLTTLRWAGAAQNDFAARIRWTLEPRYRDGNHAPTVRADRDVVRAKAGRTVRLGARTSDPDRDGVAVSWWQYREEGTYPGAVTVTGGGNGATVQVPADARKGQTISVVVQATDDGEFPLTRYDRVTIRVS